LPWTEPFAGKLRAWAATDVAPGRLMPWLAIAYGLGIAIYFTAAHEPLLWAGVSIATLGAILTFLVRARPVAFPVLLGITAIACGFATGTLRGVVVSHPVISYPVSGVDITGIVEVREDRERSDRIVVRVTRMDAPRLDAKPDRVRLSVRKGTAPPVGTPVALKARLSPPLQPLRPGGYDFARDLYFQGIGATGFVLGQIKTAPPPETRSLWLHYATAVASVRDGIDARIRAVLSGDRASIASALITGKRDAISAPVNDAMYISSLAHVLSISGYHMAVVAGVVFFVIRAGLALIPHLANRYQGGARRNGRSRVLSRLVGCGGRDTACLHHDVRCPDRRDARPAGIDAAHHNRRRTGRVAVSPRGAGPSELPDVVRGDACPRRRI
jgi:competence protein ComEC